MLEGYRDFGPLEPTFLNAVKATIGFYVVAAVERLEVKHRSREIINFGNDKWNHKFFMILQY